MAAKKNSSKDPAGPGAGAGGKRAPTYSMAKEELEKAVQRTEQVHGRDEKSETAVEVIEERLSQQQPVKQAFIAEHLFRKTIEDAIPCGIAAVDTQGRQIYVNHTFCRMLGWHEAELIGATCPFVYWDAGDLKKTQDDYLKVMKGQIPPGGLELPFRCKNGKKLWGWVLGSMLYDSDGLPAGHLIALLDITSKKNAQDTLKKLSTQLVDAQERERRFISQDLHDSIGGRLAGIKYGLEKIVRRIPAALEDVAGHLSDLLEVIKTAIEETQRISKNLHPSVLDDLGLKAAMRDVIREFQVLYPTIQIIQHLDVDESRISDPVRILVYRVCQEALTNVGKHSRANRTTLRLWFEGRRIILTVKDNGVGMPVRKMGKGSIDGTHLGLLSMRERTDLVGGRLIVESQKGQGVLIRAEWPHW